MGSPTTTTFPSLYQLACIRYSPDTDTLHNIAIPATVDIFSDNSSIGIILERRKTIDDVLPYPPRYNPYQWRLVYAPELTDKFHSGMRPLTAVLGEQMRGSEARTIGL